MLFLEAVVAVLAALAVSTVAGMVLVGLDADGQVSPPGYLRITTGALHRLPAAYRMVALSPVVVLSLPALLLELIWVSLARCGNGRA
jgi:hypothetical protein